MTCHRLWYDSTDPLHAILTPSLCFRANDDVQTGKPDNSQDHSSALGWDQPDCKSSEVLNSPWRSFSQCHLALSQKIHHHGLCLDTGCPYYSYCVLETTRSHLHVHTPLWASWPQRQQMFPDKLTSLVEMHPVSSNKQRYHSIFTACCYVSHALLVDVWNSEEATWMSVAEHTQVNTMTCTGRDSQT